MNVQSDRHKISWLGLVAPKLARALLAWWSLLGMASPSLPAFDRLIGKSQHALLPRRYGFAVLEILFVREHERTGGHYYLLPRNAGKKCSSRLGLFCHLM